MDVGLSTYVFANVFDVEGNPELIDGGKEGKVECDDAHQELKYEINIAILAMLGKQIRCDRTCTVS